MNIESSPSEKPREDTIVIKAVLLSSAPIYSRPRRPFLIGSMPMVEAITGDIPEDEINKHLLLYENVEFLQGAISHNYKEERVGFTEGTALVIYDVPMSEAEQWAAVDGETWKFEKLSWTKYRKIQDKRFERLTKAREKTLYKMTNNWYRFFGIRLYEQVPKVIRMDVRAAKHQRDPDFPTTDRHHYHVNLKKHRIYDLLNAVEYIEQGFFLLNVECEVTVSFDGEEVYQTPKGLTTDVCSSPTDAE